MPEVLRFSIVSSIVLFIVKAYQWVLGPFIDLMMLISAGTLFAISFFISVFYFVTKVKALKRRAALPAAILVITLALVMLCPLTSWSRYLDYLVNRSAREAVVQMIQAGELKRETPDGDRINLPRRYRHLSEDGVIRVHREQGTACEIKFRIWSGILGNATDMVYRIDPSHPFHDSDENSVKPISGPWVFVYWH